MDLQFTLDRLSFGQEQRIRFYTMLREFIKDGIPVYEALKDIDAGSKELRMFPQSLTSGLMSAMRGASGSPRSLGEALTDWVDPVEAALIDAGQTSGRLETGLHEVVAMMHAKRRIRSTILSSMAYPVMLLLMLGGFLWMISHEIIPVMAEVLPRVKWPPIARVLGGIADHATLFLFLLFGSIIVIGAGFVATAGRWYGAARDFCDRYVMPWSSYCQIQASMTLISIAMMIEAGVPVATAIHQLHRIGTSWQGNHYERMFARLRKGKTEAEAIVGSARGEGMFDAETAWEVRMYGARTNFSTAMRNLALRAIDRLEVRLKKQANLLRNILLIFVAGMLALTFSSFMAITMSVSKRGPF